MQERDTQTLAGKRILLGVCGSIAAYKAADVCSRLGKLGADVHVALTQAGSQFVGAATFRALTRNPVVSDVFDEPTAQRIAHIDLAQSADLVLVAPASADMIARMAHGLADDMLAACLLATPRATPLLVAPAMNTQMWEHPATLANVALIASRGAQIIAPGVGLLACQDIGTGKLADVDDIVDAVVARLTSDAAANDNNTTIANNATTADNVAIANDKVASNATASDVPQELTGARVLITAGATREPLDPVRFLSNRSSGKMGYALAQAAAQRGASVVVVSGFATAPVPPGVTLHRVGTAQEMLDVCQNHFAQSDVFIAAAAVADYAPETVQPHKIKKNAVIAKRDVLQARETEDVITLRLKRTPDILATLARDKRPGQVVVGFAAETRDMIAHARAKIEAKGLDMIVANDVTQEGAGFEGDTNIVTLLWPDGRGHALAKASKAEIAALILDEIQCLRP